MLDPKSLEIAKDALPWVKIDLTRTSSKLEIAKDGLPWDGWFISFIPVTDFSGGFDEMNGGFDE